MSYDMEKVFVKPDGHLKAAIDFLDSDAFQTDTNIENVESYAFNKNNVPENELDTAKVNLEIKTESSSYQIEFISVRQGDNYMIIDYLLKSD